MIENEKKLAGEVWYDWCNTIYKSRPKNYLLDTEAGEEIFNRYFNFMRNKFDCLLIFRYGLKPEDVENNIPSIRINPDDWKTTSTFWSDIIIFISYDLTDKEIEFAMSLAQPDYMKVDEKENLNAYAEFRRGFDRLKKLHPLEAN